MLITKKHFWLSREWITPPSVITLPATGIKRTQATLNGRIADFTATIRGFEWGKQSGNYTDSWTEEGSFPPGSFSHTISGLDPDTTYYFRAKAYSTDAGWIYGDELSFHTTGWLTGWSYRKSHVINPASGAGTNYQVRIVAHYGSGTDSDEHVYLNGKCRTDFGDIRFTRSDGVSLLDYWMESKVDGDNAVFWVEVADDLSTNPATIYIYYGKADATTTSNGENTFLFFEDFETGNSPADTGWSVDKTTGTVVEGYSTTIYKTGTRSFYQTTSSAVRDKRWGRSIPLTDNFAFMGWGRRSGSVTTYARDPHYGYIVVCSYSVINGNAGQRMYCGHNNVLYGMGEIDDEISLGVTVPDAEWHKYEIRKVWNTIYFYYDNTLKGYKTITTTPNRLSFGAFGVDSATTFYYDALALRKFVYPEPSHGAWGSEETPVAVAETIVAMNFPMDYLPSPIKAEQLTSKVSGATIQQVSQDYPLTLIKKDKAAELKSKFTTT
jgi:hypothetical protein